MKVKRTLIYEGEADWIKSTIQANYVGKYRNFPKGVITTEAVKLVQGVCVECGKVFEDKTEFCDRCGCDLFDEVEVDYCED